MRMKKGRKLKNMEIDEVSLVKTPANNRFFFFVKSELAEKMKSGATTVSSEPEAEKMLDKREEDTDAIEILKSLSDDEVDPDKLDFAEEYLELTGEKLNEDQIEKAGELPAKVLAAIKGAFRILNTYRDDLPENVKNALSLLGKYTAGKYPHPAPYQKTGDDDEMNDEEMKKIGKKMSKADATKLAETIKHLTGFLPSDFLKGILDEEEKAENENGLFRRLEELLNNNKPGEDEKSDSKDDRDEKDGEDDKEDGKGDDSKDVDDSDEKDNSIPTLESISKTLERIEGRLAVVEKSKGIRKGLENDEDSADSDSEDPFPSFPDVD